VIAFLAIIDCNVLRLRSTSISVSETTEEPQLIVFNLKGAYESERNGVKMA
jgi:hypothetical protein